MKNEETKNASERMSFWLVKRRMCIEMDGMIADEVTS